MHASNYTVEEINQLKGKHIQLTQSVSQLDEFIKQRQDKTYDFTTMAGNTIKVTTNSILKTIAKTHNTQEINGKAYRFCYLYFLRVTANDPLSILLSLI